jgi:predicted nucleic acid-binding protein
MSEAIRVVLDTNIFVAAGFNPQSSSAQILQMIRGGLLRMVWDEPTHAETRYILQKIPPLRWEVFADLFDEPSRHDGAVTVAGFERIADPDDRKFAALAHAAHATLITSDDHLRQHAGVLPLRVVTPSQFLNGN